ncbi:MAG TPA: DUF2905 domain-containing protein [Gemmatimonadota bacterium]|nr:DUF2905 domain-containing protein [Gemmatimonadota bacterium]
MTGQVGKMLLVAGLALAALGLVLLVAGRLGLGKLPGDIVWRGDGWTVYVPLGRMILLSVLLTVLLNLLSRR